MRSRSIRALVGATCAVAIVVATLTPVGAAQRAVDADASVAVEILGVETEGIDLATALAGAPHDAEVLVQVANLGARVQRDVVVRVETATSVVSSAPVDLRPGDAVVATLSLRVSGVPGATYDIVASAGDATATVTHRQVPWLLVGAAVLALHIAALHGRDLLRAKVVRSGALETVQPSPSQTWARSSRYSDTS